MPPDDQITRADLQYCRSLGPKRGAGDAAWLSAAGAPLGMTLRATAGGLVARNLRSECEVRAAFPLEEAGYSEDEAASRASMLYRFREAPHLFLGAFAEDGSIVGYIMSTQAAAPLVTHASMSTHDPAGSTVCIHSVCVSPAWQRKGVASMLLREYTTSMRNYNSRLAATGSAPRLARLAMLSREHLLPLYERAGYTTLGRSSVVHGAESWYDCILDL